MHWNLRKKSALAIVVVAGLALTGCAGSPGETTDSKSVNVQLMNHFWTDAILPLIPEFEAETGIKVNHSSLAESQLTDQYNIKLNTETSEFDVMLYRTAADGPVFKRNGWLEDLTDRVTENPEYDWADFTDGPVEMNKKDGRLYGIPILVDNEIMYYNKDLLAAKNIAVPTTMDELKAAAAAINDPQNGVFGFVARGATNLAVSAFSGFLFSFGGDFDDHNGTATIDSEEAIAAYEYYGGLLRDYGPPGTSNMSWQEASAVFASGKAGFYVDADSIFKSITDPASSAVVDSVGYAVMPAGPAGAKPYAASSWAIGISKFSKNKDNAWKFIEWATGKMVMLEEMKGGTLSPRKSTWDEPGAAGGFPEELFEVSKATGLIGIGYQVPQVEQVGRARDIVGLPYVIAQEGGDVRKSAIEANKEYQALLDSENK